MIDRLSHAVSTALCLFALVACVVDCTATQRKDARTALQAIDAACDALEVVQADGTVSFACDLTDDLRDEAIRALRPKRKAKRPRPVACSSAAPAASAGAP